MIPNDFSVYAQPKVDSHCHVLDPERFAYAAETRARLFGFSTGSGA